MRFVVVVESKCLANCCHFLCFLWVKVHFKLFRLHFHHSASHRISQNNNELWFPLKITVCVCVYRTLKNLMEISAFTARASAHIHFVYLLSVNEKALFVLMSSENSLSLSLSVPLRVWRTFVWANKRYIFGKCMLSLAWYTSWKYLNWQKLRLMHIDNTNTNTRTRWTEFFH